MTRDARISAESDRQRIERERIDKIRPPWESLSEMERATLLLHREPSIARDEPELCRQRLLALGVAVELESRARA